MKEFVNFIALCGTFLLVSCASESEQHQPLSHQIVMNDDYSFVLPMDEFALANCSRLGGMPAALHNLDGSIESKCQLSNGKRL